MLRPVSLLALTMGIGIGLAACTTPPPMGEFEPVRSTTAATRDAPGSEAPGAAPAPAQGPDMTLAAMSPEAGPVRVGLAGEDPADIARYLLASGAAAPALSPDGQSIAYRSGITGVPQLWIVPAAGGAPRQLTFGNGITFFRWIPGSDALIYGADNDGNEQESYFRIRADGSEETLILPAVDGGFRVFGDITADGRTLAFASTERNGLDFDIYTADLETGEVRRIHEGNYGIFARAFSPDGRTLILTESVGEDSDKLYRLDVASGEIELVSAPEPRANHGDGGFAWDPNGKSLFLASNADREFAAIMEYNVRRGRISPVIETARDAGNLTLCGPNGRYLVFTENVDGFHRLHVRDRRDGSILTPPDLPEGLYSLSCGPKTNRLAIGVNGWATPGDVYLYDIPAGKLTRPIASNMAGLDPDRLVRPESMTITARDGVELQGLLYLPDARSLRDNRLPPVIFEVHGGPTSQSMASWDAVVQYHVDQGFAVFEPNVRGSTGFGRTYTTLDDRERRRDSVADLIDLLEGLADDGRVDTSRAAVSGGSYGGYMVNAVLALYPGAFRAGVSRYGVADWVTALEIASPALKASDRIEYGDITEQRWRDFYTENSPIRLADRIGVPVLYSHGVMDPRIDIHETELMVKTLRANGIEAPYIRIPDEGHGWRKLSNRLYYYRKQAEFLETVLGGDERPGE